ncbi:diphthine--ammonia ligase [Candidatus Bathyarchaeota archaeon]|nr:diphthine--ammonia ligase [Candidatus Bathyarchaeota archaeon]
MRLASLFSGGKDSTYATHLMESEGYNVKFLVTIQPLREDSWMFHSINSNLTPLIAEALDIQVISMSSSGEKEVELSDLHTVLKSLPIDGVVSGAIASNYQKKRIDEICKNLNLKHFSPLWGMPPEKVLDDEISSGMDIIFTAVAAAGFNEQWLGKKLDQNAIKELSVLNSRFGLNICGEGGEYETLVLDAPWFNKKLNIIKAEVVWNGTNGTYVVKQVSLEKK